MGHVWFALSLNRLLSENYESFCAQRRFFGHEYLGCSINILKYKKVNIQRRAILNAIVG